MKRLYFVLLVVFLVLLLGGCFSMFDMLNGSWKGVIDRYEFTIIVDWSATGRIYLFDGYSHYQYNLHVTERTPNKNLAAYFDHWKNPTSRTIVEVTLENPTTVLVIFYKNANGGKGDLMYQGYLYKQI